MGIFTARFWDDWGKMWGANGLRRGRTKTLLHHDNAPAQTSLVVREFLTKNIMTTVPHSSNSPDLAPCDFYMFSKMKLRLKGQSFVSVEEIQAIITGTKHANTNRLQWLLPEMAESLGSLYTSPGWLLRRWQWKLGLKVSIHVITRKFSEILGSP